MQNLINETSVLENKWLLISEDNADLTQANIMIPAQVWLENKDSLSDRKDVAIWLAGDTDLSAFESLDQFETIAINFPAFADGRGYSLARLVSERFNFKGEIRAIGDVLIDQLFFMKRCGFTSYLLKEGLDAEKALNYFSTFTDPYQLAADIKEPLFRRKA